MSTNLDPLLLADVVALLESTAMSDLASCLETIEARYPHLRRRFGVMVGGSPRRDAPVLIFDNRSSLPGAGIAFDSGILDTQRFRNVFGFLRNTAGAAGTAVANALFGGAAGDAVGAMRGRKATAVAFAALVSDFLIDLSFGPGAVGITGGSSLNDANPVYPQTRVTRAADVGVNVECLLWGSS